MTEQDRVRAERAVELAARSSYGRLVALLAARCGDIAAAEDALSEAFMAALAQWPEAGVPERPEAWLVVVARRRLLDGRRRSQVQEAAADALTYAAGLTETASADGPNGGFPDERLAMLFACAHPAIDPAMHTPLMLQLVLGMDAATIASAFLVAPATMAQRLVRAKTKIRDAGIRITVPELSEARERLAAVLDAVYAAYGTAWQELHGADGTQRDLGPEAVWLARVLHTLLPAEPEVGGLLALLLYCDSRRLARRAEDGAYVPLDAQDVARWDRAQVMEAEQLLSGAAKAGQLGRFQLEAAIQSAHMARLHGQPTNWTAIAQLYEAATRLAPSVGLHVARAAALMHAAGSEPTLAALDGMPEALVSGYQPWWALRAEVLRRLGRSGESRTAYVRAAGMTEDPGVRRWLLTRADEPTGS